MEVGPTPAHTSLRVTKAARDRLAVLAKLYGVSMTSLVDTLSWTDRDEVLALHARRVAAAEEKSAENHD